MNDADQELRRKQQQILLRLALGDSKYHSMVRTLKQDPRILTAHDVDIVVRKDGVERRIEADWLKELAKAVGLRPTGEYPAVLEALSPLATDIELVHQAMRAAKNEGAISSVPEENALLAFERILAELKRLQD